MLDAADPGCSPAASTILGRVARRIRQTLPTPRGETGVVQHLGPISWCVPESGPRKERGSRCWPQATGSERRARRDHRAFQGAMRAPRLRAVRSPSTVLPVLSDGIPRR